MTELNPQPDNMRIWTAAYCTDPAHVKTAPCSDGRKHPIVGAPWVFRRATELFGPRGIGWGTTEVNVCYQHEHGVVLVDLVLWYVDPVSEEHGEVPYLATQALDRKIYRTDAQGNRIKGADGQHLYDMVPDHEATLKAFTSATKGALRQLGFGGDLLFEQRPLGGSSATPDPTPGPHSDPPQAPPQRSNNGASGDAEPASDKQMALLRKLSPEDARKNLTKSQASNLISQLMADKD